MPSWRSHPRASRALAIAGCVLAVPAGMALGALGERDASGPRVGLSAGGDLEISDSREGSAILSAVDLAPGGEVSGEVTISNSGEAEGALSLEQVGLEDSGGQGGALSEALMLRVDDVTGGAETSPVYAGSLGGLGSQELLVLPAGDGRSYRFTAWLPRGASPGEDGNDVQGATVRTTFRWTLAQDSAPACGNVLFGGPEADDLVGTEAGDRLAGGGGDDRIDGRGGDDCATGGPGADRIFGREGSDEIYGELGPDVLDGGEGDDRIHSRGGGRDLVRCGAGDDRAVVGPQDRVRGC